MPVLAMQPHLKANTNTEIGVTTSMACGMFQEKKRRGLRRHRILDTYEQLWAPCWQALWQIDDTLLIVELYA
eukprot:scaffold603263_cov20-Prasinocladus_malaysianus.AAC.1